MNSFAQSKKFGATSVVACSATALVAFALVACSNDCSCELNGVICLQESSSSDAAEILSSGDVPASSEVLASSSSVAIPDTVLSSSSVVVESYSSRALSSSSQKLSSSSVGLLAQCENLIDMCIACDGYFCPHGNRACNECRDSGMMVRDCETGVIFTCMDYFGSKYWSMEEVQCLNVASTKCMGNDANCGRKKCSVMAPDSIADCNSGDEYVCVDGHWTLTNLSKFCNDLPDNQKKRLDDKCDANSEAKAYDCVQRKELVCNDGYWREAMAVVGKACAFESDMRVEKKFEGSGLNSSYVHIFTVCSEGKWIEYQGDDRDGVALEGCRRHPMHRTPCDENAPQEISSDDCTFKCRDGEYIFVPPAVQ